MPEIIIHVVGLDELQRTFSNIETRLADGQMIGQVATIVQDQAFENATATHERGYPNVGVGRMASSIATEVISPYTAIVGPSAYYAPFVELGHRQTPGRYVSVLGKRLVKAFAPAYPFMRPVPMQVKDKVQSFVTSWINKIIGESKI